MSAPNPTGGEREFDALRRAQRAHEPSMEEILASIRAIIADDRVAEPRQARRRAETGRERGSADRLFERFGPALCAPFPNPSPSRRNTQSAPAPTTPVSEAAPVAWRRPPSRSAPLAQAGARAVDPDARNLAGAPSRSTEPPMLSDEADRAVSAIFSCAVDEPCVPKRADRSHDAGNPASDDQDVARRAPSRASWSGSCARKFSASRAAVR